MKTSRFADSQIITFLDASDREHAIRLAISFGGGVDTQAAIAGGIGAAYCGQLQNPIVRFVECVLAGYLLAVFRRFSQRFPDQPRFS